MDLRAISPTTRIANSGCGYQKSPKRSIEIYLSIDDFKSFAQSEG